MSIDRTAATRRPPGKAIGLQRWRDLLFLHWPVTVEAVRSSVPAGLTIDTFDGVAYVGLVAFVMEGMRPAGFPEALALSFLETNARTYVHADGNDPGVFFFSLDAASRFAVVAARATFGLPYYHARMRISRDGSSIEYTMVRSGPLGRRPSLSVRYEPGEPLGPAEPGTLDHFLIERYILHVERSGRLWTARLHHRAYPRQRANVEAMSEDLFEAAGIFRPPGLPPIVHYARGVDVELFSPRLQRSTHAA